MYKGKYFKITAIITDIGILDGKPYIEPKLGLFSFTTIRCYFRESEVDNIVEVKKEDEIEFIGQIGEIGSRMDFNNCVVLSWRTPKPVTVKDVIDSVLDVFK
jgi:hypothetical protein